MGRFDFHGWSPPESFRAGHVVVNEEELPHLTSRGVQDNLPGYDFRIEHIVDTKFRPLFPTDPLRQKPRSRPVPGTGLSLTDTP